MRAGGFLIGALVLLLVACSSPFGFVDEGRRMILQGVVTDGASGQPLEGVYVSLEWTPEDNPDPGQGAIVHVDTSTADDGSYRVEAKLAEVNCTTAFLRVASVGYKAVLIHPDCKAGKQTFDVALPPS
jgi:hypothetical protein